MMPEDITQLLILSDQLMAVYTETNKYLANCWNSEYKGFPHVRDPIALARAACLFPPLDVSVYFLIIS
jgi:hypothetical protein